MALEWLKKQSSFKYSGNPVTRVTMVCQTPLGEFKVYEAVNGNCFIVHPFIKSPYISNIPGFGSYDNGTEDWFGKPKIRCKSLDEGLVKCQQKWEQVKSAINKI